MSSAFRNFDTSSLVEREFFIRSTETCPSVPNNKSLSFSSIEITPKSSSLSSSSSLLFSGLCDFDVALSPLLLGLFKVLVAAESIRRRTLFATFLPSANKPSNISLKLRMVLNLESSGFDTWIEVRKVLLKNNSYVSSAKTTILNVGRLTKTGALGLRAALCEILLSIAKSLMSNSSSSGCAYSNDLCMKVLAADKYRSICWFSNFCLSILASVGKEISFSSNRVPFSFCCL
mmetsp:Transcript_2924/g.2845  ORF Transcript_2924/g.2845 Transcript_2924/m.2845 type:complete len:232 (-) Transcript_2924:302-997(-)